MAIGEKRSGVVLDGDGRFCLSSPSWTIIAPKRGAFYHGEFAVIVQGGWERVRVEVETLQGLREAPAPPSEPITLPVTGIDMAAPNLAKWEPWHGCACPCCGEPTGLAYREKRYLCGKCRDTCCGRRPNGTLGPLGQHTERSIR